MASQGNYDHPSYLTRQQLLLGASTAGANGTSGGKAFLSDMRIRKASAMVRVAGTSAAGGNACILLCIGTYMSGFSTGLIGTALTTNTGTNTLATIALGSSAAFATATSTDINVRIQAGSVLVFKNGTDATGTYDVTMESYLDPGATWTGPPGS
jgi:hypothetical protein